MKFRLMLASIFITSVIAALAEDSSPEDTLSCTNFLGVLKTAFGATDTVIAVPWVAGMNGETESPVAVGDLVQTANLDKGDMLFALTGEEGGKKCYEAWVVGEADVSGIKHWESVTEVTTDGDVKISPPSKVTGVNRGSALILRRKTTKNNEGKLAPVFLKGVLANATTVRYELPAGEMSLIAPPSVVTQSFTYEGDSLGFLNNIDKVVFTGVNENDKILIPTAGQPVTIGRKDGKWYLQKLQAKILKLPAGTGMWYKSAGDETVTVTWKAGVPGIGLDK